MVKLANQEALLFLCPLALGHIDCDANHASWAPTTIVCNEITLLDPSDIALSANDAVFGVQSVPLIREGLVAKFFDALKVLGVHPHPPLIDCRLGSSLASHPC